MTALSLIEVLAEVPVILMRHLTLNEIVELDRLVPWNGKNSRPGFVIIWWKGSRWIPRMMPTMEAEKGTLLEDT
jgi:hypothetical protein